MDIQHYLQRAHHLLNLGRHAEAITELRQAMTLDPNNAQALLLLTVAYTHGDEPNRAIQAAQELLGIDPNSNVAHYYLSVNSLVLNKVREAEMHIRAAIEGDPSEADYFAQYAQVYLYKKDFAKALQKAQEGLALDAENLACLNTRIEALTKLGYKSESASAAYETLATAPDNAYSHANVGWSKLENRDIDGAKYHFAEALRLNPSLDSARSGMLEAMKSKNFFYRYFLYWVFWLSKKTENAQWALVIGIWLGMRVLDNVSDTVPILKPVFYLGVFLIYLTWFTTSLFNLMLMLDPIGRHILDDREKKAAYATGIGIAVILSSIGFYFITDFDWFLVVAIVCGMLMLPVIKYFGAEEGQLRQRVGLFALGMTFTAMISILPLGALSSMVFNVHLIGFIAFQLLYNYWMINRRLI
jgi:tetratricopeptide (TPR) repeat protein